MRPTNDSAFGARWFRMLGEGRDTSLDFSGKRERPGVVLKSRIDLTLRNVPPIKQSSDNTYNTNERNWVLQY